MVLKGGLSTKMKPNILNLELRKRISTKIYNEQAELKLMR